MKNKLTLLATLLLLSWGVFAQTPPEGVNYQAVLRNLTGTPLVNQAVDVRFTIHQSSGTGTIVFQEVHSPTTNPFGLVNLVIGSVNTTDFPTINWGLGTYFLQVEVNDGSGFQDLGATQLLSVPYALHAKTASSGVPGADGYNSLLDTLSAGAVCPNGGYQVLMGLDTDASGILDAGEVTKTFIVCNGADGATGPAGASGTTYFAGNGISLSNDTITNLGDADADPNNELQTLSLNTTQDSLFITNGNGIELPTVGGDNWGSQVVQVDGTTITGDGDSTPLSGFDGDYNSLSNQPTIPTKTSDLTNDSGFITSPNDADADTTNELQTLSLNIAQDSLFISNGNGIELPAPVGDNWGSQVVQVDGTTITGDGDSTPLSGFDGDYNSLSNQPTIPTNTSDLTNDSGFITSEVDGDITNELQTLSASGGTSPQIDLSNGGGNVTIQGTGGTTVNQSGNTITINSTTGTTYTAGTGIDLTSNVVTNTAPDQTVTITGSGSTAVSGTYPNFTISSTDNVNDADADATNELQSLTFANPNLSITGGNSVDLSSLSGPTYTPGTGIDITGNTISNTSLNTDDQQLTYNAGTQTLQLTTTTTPSTVTLDVNDADASTTNELITSFGVNGANLEIIEAGTTRTVPLSSLSTPDNDWTIVGSTIYRSIGNVGVGQNIAGSNIKFRVLADDSVGVSVENNSASYAAIDARNMGGGLAGKFRDGNVHIQNNLGIGNTAATPTYNLQVDGTTWSKGMRLGITGSEYDMPNTNGFLGQVLTTNASGNAEWQTPATTATYWSQTGNNIYPTTIANNVGIGTSTPALGRKLEVINNDVVANNMAIHGQSSGANASNIGVQGYALNSTSQNVGVSGIGQGNTGTNYGVSGSATGAATTNMGVYGNASGGTNNYAGYFSGGNVYVTNNLGVGISSPTHKLDVQSNSFELLKLTTTGANSNVNVDINTTGSGAAQFTVTGGTGGFSFVTDGTWPTSAMNIIDNGNVGIGINPPTSKLHVQGSGSTSVTSALNVQNSSGVSSLYVRDDGDIGIGTTSPAMKLNISDNTTTITPQFEIENTSTGDAAMRFDGGGNYFSVGIDYSDGTKFKISDYTQLGTNDRLTIDLSGKVGIGTANPSYKLQVEDAAVRRTGYFMNTTNAGNIVNDELMGIYGGAHGSGASDKIGGFFETSSGSGVNYGVYAQAMGGATNWAGYFASGNVYIQNNLGVGTTSPSSKLDVNGTINISNNAGEINNSVKTGAANLLPIAYGNIAQDANINASTGNFSVIWNATNLWYEITIIGEAFNFSNYIVNVTRISGISGVTEATSSLGGKLIVVFNDQGGTKVQNAFQFVVYKP